MTPQSPPPPGNTDAEVSALIETLHQTGQRLEELTAGEVDTVTSRDGRTVLLRRAQEHLRLNEAAKQAAILNALPTHVALLDAQGTIISVNAAWRKFAIANVLQSPGYGVGLNYIEICDHAQGADAAEALQVAAGIRSVLAGAARIFSLEYPCHSPTEKRWFQMAVAPLAETSAHGAVVMHLDITERKLLTLKLAADEAQLHTLVHTIPDLIWLKNAQGVYLNCNPVFERFFGAREADIIGKTDYDFVGKELADFFRAHDRKAMVAGKPSANEEWLTFSDDGYRGLFETIKTPMLDAQGELIGVLGIARDITERKRLEQEKEQYFKFFMLSTNPMCIADPYGCFKQVNPAFLQLIGYSESDLLSKPFLDFVLPEDRQRTANEMKLQVESRSSLHFENRYMRNDGTVIHLSWMGYFDKHDGVSYATANDITERKAADARIKHLNRVYAVLSGINTLIVRVRDRDELFREACRIAIEAGGFRMAMIAIVDPSSMKVVPVASAGKDEDLLSAIKDVLSSNESAPKTMGARAIKEKKLVVSNNSQSDPQVVFGQKYAEAGVRSMVVLPLLVSDEAVGVLALYASEIEFFQEEELKLLMELAGDVAFAIDHLNKQARLNYLAYYDELTGLANRTLFLERLAQYKRSAVSGGHKVALFLIDLERFRNINDSLGRPAGDELLRQVAQWLTRDTVDATLVSRVGANLFATVLPVVKQEGDVARLLEKTMEAFENHPFRLNDAVFRIAAKVGIALFPDDGTDAETLFKHAEAALKMAKASGERYLFYTQKMTEAAAGKLTLENQLRQALDNEEFVLHYQPKVNLTTGKMTSAEALIRWNDPRTGLVPPGRFIPILEETGLIYDVGRWALRQAIEDYLRWCAAGLPAVRIAVNVSPLQLRNRGFIDEIRAGHRH